MSKFRTGQSVRIKKGLDPHIENERDLDVVLQGHMLKYGGEEDIVEEVDPTDGTYKLKNNQWWWHESWLEEVRSNDIPVYEPGGTRYA